MCNLQVLQVGEDWHEQVHRQLRQVVAGQIPAFRQVRQDRICIADMKDSTLLGKSIDKFDFQVNY